MSVINRMLQDLDQRQASGSDVESLPPQVRAPLRQPSRSWRAPLLAAGLLVSLGAVFAYWTAHRPESRQLAENQSPAALPAGSAPALAPAAPAAPAEVPGVTPPIPAATPTMPAATPTAPAVPPAVELGLGDSALSWRLDRHLPNFPRSTPDRSSPAKTQTVALPAAVTQAAETKVRGGGVEKLPAAGSSGERSETDYRRALDELSRGRTGEATAILRAVLQTDPGHGSARQLLVSLLFEQNNLDEARTILRDGLHESPKQLQWAMGLARIEIARGDNKAAWEALEPGLSSAANYGEYQAFAGAVLQRLGKPAEAADRFRLALQLTPGNGRWWIGLGLALDADGHPAEAREAFRRAVAAGQLTPEQLSFAEQKSR